MIKETLTVNRQAGLHGRPAGELVQLCKKYQSEIKIGKDTPNISANSILAIMAMGVTKGEKVVVSADGPDEAAAMSALKELFSKE